MYLCCVFWFVMDLERGKACEEGVLWMESCKKMESYVQICLKDGKQRFQGKFGDFARVIAL